MWDPEIRVRIKKPCNHRCCCACRLLHPRELRNHGQDTALETRSTTLPAAAEPQAAPSPYPGPDRELTSSSGNSLSSGSELVSSPMRKGVGEHTMSIMAGGSTGM